MTDIIIYSKALLIFPNQLVSTKFLSTKLFPDTHIFLIEDSEFFNNYTHLHKLIFHRASMKSYYYKLKDVFRDLVSYIDFKTPFHEIIHPYTYIFTLIQPDLYVNEKIMSYCNSNNKKLIILENPGFLYTNNLLKKIHNKKNIMNFNVFYSKVRADHDIPLYTIEEFIKPSGNLYIIPQGDENSSFVTEAINYINSNFPKVLGNKNFFKHPICSDTAKEWLNHFLQYRLKSYSSDSCAYDLTPQFNDRFPNYIIYIPIILQCLNTGLLSPKYVINKTLEIFETRSKGMYNKKKIISIRENTVAKFLLDIIVKREYYRYVSCKTGLRLNRRVFTRLNVLQTNHLLINTIYKNILTYGYISDYQKYILFNYYDMIGANQDILYMLLNLCCDFYSWNCEKKILEVLPMNKLGILGLYKKLISPEQLRYSIKTINTDLIDEWELLYKHTLLNNINKIYKDKEITDNYLKYKQLNHIDKQQIIKDKNLLKYSKKIVSLHNIKLYE